MKVYIVETGCYESCFVSGVYATPEAAMRAHPVPDRPIIRHGATCEREGGWQLVVYPNQLPDARPRWSNGLDWSDAASIEEYDVIE